MYTERQRCLLCHMRDFPVTLTPYFLTSPFFPPSHFSLLTSHFCPCPLCFFSPPPLPLSIPVSLLVAIATICVVRYVWQLLSTYCSVIDWSLALVMRDDEARGILMTCMSARHAGKIGNWGEGIGEYECKEMIGPES